MNPTNQEIQAAKDALDHLVKVYIKDDVPNASKVWVDTLRTFITQAAAQSAEKASGVQMAIGAIDAADEARAIVKDLMKFPLIPPFGADANEFYKVLETSMTIRLTEIITSRQLAAQRGK